MLTDAQSQDEQRPNPTRGDEANDAAVLDFVIEAARLLEDSNCEDVIVLDVRGQSQVTDYIIVASGTSDRQMRSTARDLRTLAKKHPAVAPYGEEQDDETFWVVADFVEAIVHLFEPNMRAHYDLEMMWGDAPQIDWQRS